MYERSFDKQRFARIEIRGISVWIQYLAAASIPRLRVSEMEDV